MMTHEESQHRKRGAHIPKAKPRGSPRARASAKPVKLKPDGPSQREMIARLRHDLRTPLNAIIGYGELLMEDAEEMAARDEGFMSDLRNIHSAGNKSLELVNTILHPAKMESDPEKFGLEAFGVNLRRELHTPSNAIVTFTERLLKNAEMLGKKNAFIAKSVPDLKRIQDAAQDFLRIIRKTEDLSSFADMMQKETRSPLSLPGKLPLKADQASVNADSGDLLVVEDDDRNRDLLTRRLEQQGHTVSAAKNGREALKMIKTRAFDAVLLDIMMPEMDGHQVLQRLKEHETLRNIPVIMISALDEMGSVVRCIEMGAEDYLMKPFDPVLLKARVGAVLEKKRLRDKEQIYLKSLELELEIGRKIQSSFLPDALPQLPGWEIAIRFRPAKQVSGDFYDAFPLSESRELGIVIADVCGKGVGAALFMGLFRSLIRAFFDMHSRTWMNLMDEAEKRDPVSRPTKLAPKEEKPGFPDHANALRIAVSLTNDYIAKNHGDANMFATLFLGVIDAETGTLTYINGGHEPPVIVSPDGVKEHLEPTGVAVGLLPLDMLPQPFAVGSTQIEPGHILLSFTDGVTEASDPNGRLYTKQRLFSLFSEPADSAEALLGRIEAGLEAYTAGAEQSDDITLLAVRRMLDA